MSEFYDGTKLLSLSDRQGKKPLIYFCVGNRTAGKSYYFKRLLLRRFIKKKEQFILLVRNVNEIKGITQGFFEDISYEFPSYNIEERGLYNNKILFIYLTKEEGEKELCGYCFSLKDTEIIKKNSSLFVNVKNILFDEFQSETNQYLKQEVSKLQNILTSVCRGGGKHIRENVNLFMVSNKVSLVNPYFLNFNISRELKQNTKFLRGNGYVLEVCYVESASKAIKESALGRLFEGSTYSSYANDNIYLLDNYAFIEKIEGSYIYVCTLKYENQSFSVKYYHSQNLYYVDQIYDPTYKIILSLDIQSHNENSLYNNELIRTFKTIFESGRFRFKNIECKNVILESLKYL